MKDKNEDKIRELREEGLTVRNIADKVNVSKSTVSRILSQNNLSQKRRKNK